MKFFSNRYAKVYTYKGFDICTLKIARPSNGDRLGYVIDDVQFAEKDYDKLVDAVRAIDMYHERSHEDNPVKHRL